MSSKFSAVSGVRKLDGKFNYPATHVALSHESLKSVNLIHREPYHSSCIRWPVTQTYNTHRCWPDSMASVMRLRVSHVRTRYMTPLVPGEGKGVRCVSSILGIASCSSIRKRKLLSKWHDLLIPIRLKLRISHSTAKCDNGACRPPPFTNTTITRNVSKA